MNGYGELNLNDKFIYKGNFKDGYFEGQGVLNLYDNWGDLTSERIGLFLSGKFEEGDVQEIIQSRGLQSLYGYTFNGKIQIFTSGTDSTLIYTIDSMMTWQDTAKFHFLEEGNYYVVIEDTNGCRVDWGFVGVTVETTTNIDMSVQVTDIICNGDTNGTFRVLYPDSCYSYTLWRYTISPPYYLPIDTGTYFNGLIPL